MRIVVTGGRGTVGRILVGQLRASGHEVVLWLRDEVPVDDLQAHRVFLSKLKPAVLYHLAIASTPTGLANEDTLVNCDWPIGLAALARELSIRFIFTSTAMVFSNDAVGPLRPDSIPDAVEGYGHQKKLAETGVRQLNRDAVIVRLGWQIGDSPGSNNMIDFVHQNLEGEGQVKASQKWLPACSFLQDTADALMGLMGRDPGLYMIDSNRGWNFFEILTALKALHNADWTVACSQDFVLDQRLIDPKMNVPPLSDHLPSLSLDQAAPIPNP